MIPLKLVKSDKTEDNQEALRALAELDNVTISLLPFDSIFSVCFVLPFIQTDDGTRHYGLSGIKRFAKELNQEINKASTKA